MLVGPETTTSHVPPIFGTAVRTEIMAMLAVNGPMYIREIARTRNVDASSTFRAVDRLIHAGLAVKRLNSGGRKYVAVNRAHFASRRLWALLQKLAICFDIPGDRDITYRWKLPLERDPHPAVDERNMFGHPTRSRSLTIIATADGIDLRRISQVLAIDEVSVWHTVNSLERDAIVLTKRQGKRRLAFLHPECPVSRELQQFIHRLVNERSHYKGLVAAAEYQMLAAAKVD